MTDPVMNDAAGGAMPSPRYDGLDVLAQSRGTHHDVDTEPPPGGDTRGSDRLTVR